MRLEEWLPTTEPGLQAGSATLFLVRHPQKSSGHIEASGLWKIEENAAGSRCFNALSDTHSIVACA
jgi:hypothetical protein